MPTFRVVWEIDIDADSPREAAAEALRIQRDPESTATQFVVFDDDRDIEEWEELIASGLGFDFWEDDE